MWSNNGTPEIRKDHLEVKDGPQLTIKEIEEQNKKMEKEIDDELRAEIKQINKMKRKVHKTNRKNEKLEKINGDVTNEAYRWHRLIHSVDEALDESLDDSDDTDGDYGGPDLTLWTPPSKRKRVNPTPAIKPIKEMRTSSALRASVVNDQRQTTIADKVLIEVQKKLRGQWDERWGGNSNSTTGLPNKKDTGFPIQATNGLNKKPSLLPTHEPDLGRQGPRDGLYSGNNDQEEKETSDDDSEHAKSYQDDITAPHPFFDDQLHHENDHFEDHVVRGEESEDEQVEMDEEDVEVPEDPEALDEEDEQTTFAQKIMEMMKRMAYDEKVFTIYADPRYGHRSCLWDPSAAETVVQEVRTVPNIDVLMRTGASRTLYRRPTYNCENETPATWAQRKEDLLEEQKVQVKMGIIRVVPVRKIRK